MSFSLSQFRKVIGFQKCFNFEATLKELRKDWEQSLQDPFSRRLPIELGGVYGMEVRPGVWIQGLVSGVFPDGGIKISPVVPWALLEDVMDDVFVLPDVFEDNNSYAPFGVVAEEDAFLTKFKLGKYFGRVSGKFLIEYHNEGLKKLLKEERPTEVAKLFKEILQTD